MIVSSHFFAHHSLFLGAGNMWPAPVLLGRAASGEEAVKTLGVPRHKLQITFVLPCFSPLRVCCSGMEVFGFAWHIVCRRYQFLHSYLSPFWEQCSSWHGSCLALDHCPTQHLLLASRFLMLNWFGGLSCLFGLQWRYLIACFELICLQYLIHDRFKNIWLAPDLSLPRRGIRLQRVLWIEAVLLCCIACTLGLVLCMQSQIPTDLGPI